MRIPGLSLLDAIRRWRTRRLLARRPIAETLWWHALRRCAPAQRLGASDQAALRVLVTQFLQRKSLEPVAGLVLRDADRVLIALHACLPILHLGLDWYDGWHSVIVYPEAFVPDRQHTDAAGVVHRSRPALAGEAWGRGPVIVSLADALDAHPASGRNVIVHEMAHKLDMQNGEANGFPPLHKRMDPRAWTAIFSRAWDDLHARRQRGEELPMDAYALENPAEFFAVASEQFFETPAWLRQHLPDVYAQLALFYRQTPL